MVLFIVVFSYHKYARHQSIKGHHAELVRIADNIAQTGVNFVVKAIHDENKLRSVFFADEAITRLLNSSANNDVVVLKKNSGFCGKVTTLFQNICVDHLDLVHEVECERIEIAISQTAFLGPDKQLPGPHLGRDYHEKQGKITIACTVSIGGMISRQATISRDFKLFSYVPGPYSRFNFFVQASSQRNSTWRGSNPYFNVVKSDINGRYLNNDYRRLILVNAPDTESLKLDDSTAVLKKSGWVYLGNDPHFAKDTTLLNIPAGYHPDIVAGSKDPFKQYPAALEKGIGAGTYLSRATPTGNDAASYLLQNVATRRGLKPVLKTFGLFWGADSYGPWGELDFSSGNASQLSPQSCLSSWLLPYGTQHFPSPTLVVGPVLSAYLSTVVVSKPGQSFDTRFYLNNYLTGKYIRTGNFAVMTRAYSGDMNKGNNDLAYFVSQTALSQFNASLGISNGTLLTMGDIINESDQAGIKALMWSYANYPAQPCPYIPVNFLFEVVRDKYQKLDFFKLESDAADNMRKVHDRAALPGNSIWAPPEAQPNSYAYFQSADSLPIWLYSATNPNLGDTSQEVYFKASLKNCNYDDADFRNALLSRVTHIIRLPGKKSPELAGVSGSAIQEKYQEILKNRKILIEKDGKLEFHSPGIYQIIVGDGSQLEKFEFLQPVVTSCGGIFVFENADVSIKAIYPSTSEMNSLGQPEHAFSLICLDGKILLSTSYNSTTAYPVHAYLAALSKTAAGSLGKASGNGIYVNGGVAVATVEGLFEAYKRDGGIIRYNPVFNPNYQVKADQRYGFRLLTDGEVGIKFKGAK
ncbi:MAG: hypothetical protein CVV42_19310 [Candidatus Riflebacteria bacterium HGW-Riflebacteria-2]|nr:MAG: hypothetical protein CVV42_19310 [Candidatus Riflebacteria bacterium HGW-Riflebacteria-2]